MYFFYNILLLNVLMQCNTGHGDTVMFYSFLLQSV